LINSQQADENGGSNKIGFKEQVNRKTDGGAQEEHSHNTVEGKTSHIIFLPIKNGPPRGKLRGIKPYRFRILLKVIRAIRAICEICGLKISSDDEKLILTQSSQASKVERHKN
jgi:hypothetical protein